MPRFFDVITRELYEINSEDTTNPMVYYAVKVGDNYRLAGCRASDFQLLNNDPETRTSTYYPVNVSALLSNKEVFELIDADEILDAYDVDISAEESDTYAPHRERDVFVYKYPILTTKPLTQSKLAGVVNFANALPFPASPEGRIRARAAAVAPPPVAAPAAAAEWIESRMRSAHYHLVLPNGNVLVSDVEREQPGGASLLCPPHHEVFLPFYPFYPSRTVILQNNMFAHSSSDYIDIYHAENGQLLSHTQSPAWRFNRILLMGNGSIAVVTTHDLRPNSLQIFSIDDAGNLVERGRAAGVYGHINMTEMPNHCIAIANVHPEVATGIISLRIIDPATAVTVREINIDDVRIMSCIQAIEPDRLAIVCLGFDSKSYLSIYNTVTGDRTAKIDLGYNYRHLETTCITLLPNGFLGVASSHRDSGIRIYNPLSGEIVNTLPQAFPITDESHFREDPAFRDYVDNHPAPGAVLMQGGMH